jgi:hypothetical protein
VFGILRGQLARLALAGQIERPNNITTNEKGKEVGRV